MKKAKQYYKKYKSFVAGASEEEVIRAIKQIQKETMAKSIDTLVQDLLEDGEHVCPFVLESVIDKLKKEIEDE